MKRLSTLLAVLFVISVLTSSAQYTKLFDFAGTASGEKPMFSTLISDGTYLYGMTQNGGVYANDGVIFKIKPDGTGYTKIFDFGFDTSGALPDGSLYYDGTFLYGMSSLNGANNLGSVFKIKPDGTMFTKLLNFAGAANGSTPNGSLISDGTYLYGMTSKGGANSLGVIFKMKPDGSSYTKLLDFTGTTNGANPSGDLISDGTYLYGMTANGGTSNYGVVFKIKSDGSTYTKLLDFTGTNGQSPITSLYSDGTYLYGMTKYGGANNDGVVFKIKPDGTSYADLLDFSGAANGSSPDGALIASAGFLYGIAGGGGANNDGVIFKIKPDGTGFSKLFDFAGAANGDFPAGSLYSDGTASLYGMAWKGGANNLGVIFKYIDSIPPLGLSPVVNQPVQVTVYPNPNDGKFTVQIDNEELTMDNAKTKIVIYNILGEQIHTTLSIVNRQLSINLGNQPNGIYFLNTGGVYVKIIKE